MVQEIGVDRIMFSVDWPLVENGLGTAWAKPLNFSCEDCKKTLSGNVQKLNKGLGDPRAVILLSFF